MLKKILKYIITAILLLSLTVSSVFVSAEEVKNDGHITVETVSGVNGDSVLVRVFIEDNPGIMAITITFTYDSSALEYQRHYYGFLDDKEIGNHPTKNMLRFVACEKKDRTENGVMFAFKFKIKENAEFGFYPINIEYSAGDFCNWNLDKLMPKITAGGIDVAYNGENCSHKKYEDWQTLTDPTCTEVGTKSRKCTKCDHIEMGEIPATGHDFQKEWIIDKPAVEGVSGTMSRHCKNCDEVTDILAFDLPFAEQNKIENNLGTVLPPSNATDELLKDQLPEVFKENGNTSVTPDKPTENKGDNNNSALTSPEEIIESIEKESSGKLEKILSAIPDIGKIKNIFSVALILLIRLLLI